MVSLRPHVLSALRIVAGLVFTQHGVQKLFGLLGGIDGHGGTVNLPSLLGVAGFLECAGGLLLILGLFTCPVAFVLSGEMAVAYFMAHFPRSFFPVINRGETAVLLCFVFLYLAAAGGGPWSLDALRQSRSSASESDEMVSSALAPAPSRRL